MFLSSINHIIVFNQSSAKIRNACQNKELKIEYEKELDYSIFDNWSQT